MITQIIIYIYLLALVIIGVFSLEAIFLAYKFWRKNNKPDRIYSGDYQPHVTIQLPVFNELYVAGRLIDSVCALNYPIEKFQIQVLDDSTDQTYELCKKHVEDYKSKGFDIVHIHRKERTGYKAGALKNGLLSAQGELIAIFDADFLPAADFLIKTIDYFRESQIGMVQTRWEHLNEDYSLLTKTQAFGLAGHFIVEQNARNKAGYFMNFNGTAGIWRKSCIEDAGNWQADTLTEDLDLSYRAQIRGWKFLFLNDVSTPSELPAEINALKSQQYRWTKGAIETARKILPLLWRSNTPFHLKIHSTFHLTNNLVYPFIFVLALLNLPVLIIKNQIPDSAVFFVIFSFFLLSFGSSFLFYTLSQRSLYRDWIKRMWLFPIFMSGSMGFSLNNSRAVLEGLFNKKTPFIRTPKYRLIGKKGTVMDKKYKTVLDKMVIAELLMAIYCSIGVGIALYYVELGIMPFMLMFFAGFSIIAYLSIKHHFSLKFGRI